MNDKKLTDNEIIKALKEMVEYPHYYEEGQILENVLNLLTRQNAEIEKLQSMNQAKLDTIHGLQVEIDYLRADLKRGCAERRDAHTCINNFTKVESILDFSERLKQKAVGLKLVNRDYRFVSVKEIDGLVIKMSGESNGR